MVVNCTADTLFAHPQATLFVMVKFAKKVPSSELVRLYRRGLSLQECSDALRLQNFTLSKSGVKYQLQQLRKRGLLPTCAAKHCSMQLSQRNKRYAVRCVRVHNIRSGTQVAKMVGTAAGRPLSRATICRALRSGGLVPKRPRQRPLITSEQKAQRLRWARQSLAAQIDWSTVFFFDEKAWQLDGPAWRPRVWCDPQQPVPTVARRGQHQPTVTVWGAISAHAVPPLVFVGANMDSAGYCEAIAKARQSCPSLKTNLLFHDRHSTHRSKFTSSWLQQHGQQVELLPARGADLNPIENLWGILTKRVYAANKSYNTIESLCAAIECAWSHVMQDTVLCMKLMESVPERLREVVRCKGGFSCY